MSATIFTIANQKGGVGKTTTAINLAVGLAQERVPVLLIDLDPQGNATSALGFEKEDGASLYGPLRGDGYGLDKIIKTNQKHLSIIKGETDLAAIEVELAQKKDYLIQLKRVLEAIQEAGIYRAIIIDCPPALGMISMNSLVAADYLLVALQCEYLAMEGLSQILNVVEELKDAGLNPNLAVGGILMTMYDVRTRLSRQVVQEVKEHFPAIAFKTVIPRSVRLSEAPSFGQSIFEYDSISSGAVAYKQFTKEVIERFQLKEERRTSHAKEYALESA